MRCNKRGCQDYFRGEKKRKLREAMFQGNTNDPCLPKQYKVLRNITVFAIYLPCKAYVASKCWFHHIYQCRVCKGYCLCSNHIQT